MKNAFHLVAVALLLAFAACASGPPKPKYVEEKNQAKFATAKEMSQKPDDVLRAARAVLDKLARSSEAPGKGDVESEDGAVHTGWVYGPAGRDKAVVYDFNGSPRRKELSMRRIYGFEITPSLAGSHVAMTVEEEIQEIDLKTGEPKGWKRVEPERAAYDRLFHQLQDQVHAQ